MKIVWPLLALTLGILAVRAAIAATREADAISVIGLIAISVLLAWAAIAAWRRRG
ncbi:hypothetical protein GCM10011579_064710 [Streptomyces albiflavescens]|uniref:Uncharacterized protein n=1 Tax=Streptomyces albiflavescens TaxID=1623582 RepID=A0A917Y962_9ACTN|nr:hypothetical protein [Streptomyces albiflavescens]GGN79820.1 hypothetical protein GCM10011579_064710 [Streptomyces albiflavescens]